MSDLVTQRGAEIYSLQNTNSDQVLLIETQSAKIKELAGELTTKRVEVSELSRKLANCEMRKKKK